MNFIGSIQKSQCRFDIVEDKAFQNGSITYLQVYLKVDKSVGKKKFRNFDPIPHFRKLPRSYFNGAFSKSECRRRVFFEMDQYTIAGIYKSGSNCWNPLSKNEIDTFWLVIVKLKCILLINELGESSRERFLNSRTFGTVCKFSTIRSAQSSLTFNQTPRT